MLSTQINRHTIISTHTSRVGCDMLLGHLFRDWQDFYSHIPCGMWHWHLVRFWEFHNFYSHIPCGMWLNVSVPWINVINFYSHIPCGMWPSFPHLNHHPDSFLLTHPVWDVTWSRRRIEHISTFLLTHPVWDVTASNILSLVGELDFYSHIPCGMWRGCEWYQEFA